MFGHGGDARPGPARSPGANERGQATVEAAYLIPVVFLVLLLLVQPGIILYDYLVMKAAAAEGCRLLATKTDAVGDSDDACKAYVKRRLAAIPPQDQFHLHRGGCSWEIEVRGDESSDIVQVTVRNRLRLLPLFEAGRVLLGGGDSAGGYVLEASCQTRTQPLWVAGSEAGLDPEAWARSDRS